MKNKVGIGIITLLLVMGVTTAALKARSHEGTKQSKTVSNSPAKIQRLNIEQIQKGNFSTANGTWRNQEGDTVTISKTGIVHLTRAGQTTISRLYAQQSQVPTGYQTQTQTDDGAIQVVMGPKDLPRVANQSLLTQAVFLPKGGDGFNYGVDRVADRLDLDVNDGTKIFTRVWKKVSVY
ncbi:DUF6287 domain-containing protein [Fructobacillus ficulneus]|uniref:DUF6287 domain-containing protein n=1 Tax=Fructobacillus ficulneus TaxID=157463 RepID=A0A0K8MIY1_9LACO|nr:DUF6287 domain-containing protein [Fructobacillus ficulneus]GAP00496.1 hypothetical protein FFIC_285150 [Fructobacillus ficulneus]